MNINHLHLKVASVERTAAFYERCFGLRRSVSHGEVLFMRDDAGMDLALAPCAEAVSPASWFHLGFRLGSSAEVETLHTRIVEIGVAIRQPLTHEENFTVFRCADPDGYELEIYWEPQIAEA